jgi:hypothetical protein
MTWPSTFAAGTLGYMKDRIGDELARSDLSTQIAQCITDAIAIYQPHRFRFSESRDVCNFNTVVGQEFYTSADNANIATLFLFDYIVVTIAGANFKLTRRQPQDIELLSQSGTQRGQPQEFCYFNETIRLYPVPSAVYPIICAGHMSISAPTSDSAAGNRWMTTAERLIRSRAKYELSINYNIDFPSLAQIMHPDTGATSEAYDELKAQTNKLTGTGRVTPTQF